MATRGTEKKLHDLFRQIKLDFGEVTLTEERLKGLLSDYGGMSVNKFHHVLARSISFNMGRKLMEIRKLDESDYSLKLNNMRQVFQEENFFRHDIANYIIDCYLYGFEWTDTITEYNEEDNGSGNGKAGELSFTEHSGLDYCGNLNGDKERSGFGIAKDVENNYFAGEWKLNMKNGIGIDVSSEKGKYAGEWRLNRRAGIGIEILPDGNRYAGEWKNGKPHGCGIISYPNGEKMSVRFNNGQIVRGCVGIYYMKDDTYVVGEMTEDGPEGTCMHYYKGTRVQKEEWKNGKLI